MPCFSISRNSSSTSRRKASLTRGKGTPLLRRRTCPIHKSLLVNTFVAEPDKRNIFFIVAIPKPSNPNNATR